MLMDHSERPTYEAQRLRLYQTIADLEQELEKAKLGFEEAQRQRAMLESIISARLTAQQQAERKTHLLEGEVHRLRAYLDEEKSRTKAAETRTSEAVALGHDRTILQNKRISDLEAQLAEVRLDTSGRSLRPIRLLVYTHLQR